MCLAQDKNAVKSAAPQFRVMHSTTEPLRSHFLIEMVSVPHMANAMHMVETALYPIIIKFNEETIQLM